jgi:retron-type reverse transcriptase
LIDDPEQLSLFDQICEPINITHAYYRARKGLKHKTDANIIAARLEYEMHDLSDRLKNLDYPFGPYQIFTVRDPKERRIYVAPFRDRIIHHAINHFIEPIFEPSYISDSYACRKGKGNLAALTRLQKWLDGQPRTYVLKMDVKKYFASVRRETLVRMLRCKIQDRKLLKTLERLIFTAPSDGNPGKGLPIGNLTSQTFANVYLNVLDHYVKDKLGIRNYLRYVDDFAILSDNKKYLHELRHHLAEFLHERLDLDVDPDKSKVLYAGNGLPFLGFVLRPHARPKLQKAAGKRFFWRLRVAEKSGVSEPDLAAKVISWYGYAKLADVRILLERTDTLKYVDMLI